jgi:hypothetical protein
MKAEKMLAVSAALVLSLFSVVFVAKRAFSQQQELPIKGNGFAVLELFTSEGCSSCPSADALLARIQQEAGDKPVYVLGYHVDYWNHQGWKDVFSNPMYSKRQYAYSGKLGSQVYTPQLVVNGQTECIGSDEVAVNSKIKQALAGNSSVSLQLKGSLTGGKVKLDFEAGNVTGDGQLLIAVVQKHATSKVERGENSGRTLSHAQIVRDLKTFDIRSGKPGSEEVVLPADFNSKDWEIIGMIQDRESGAIEAATRATI